MDKSSLFQKFVAFTTAVHEVTLELTKDVKSETITPVQYKILEYLTVSQPVTLSEISECTQMSMPNTSRELRKLSEKQLCEKHTDAEDRRKQVIRLSEKGEAMMRRSFDQIESRFAERIKEVSEEELKEIQRALDLLHHKVFY
ncbi:MarR family winged helix-turn-helix transcriptional regulator [Paenibacillus sp. P96]|uniref:MarR family winged helix-turn-helix transcriptional regulator n=1 Tax=Paenibacillus zeirhizosphaerae TaxID=2987519 RepID=A0ABT9FMA3_9BACL|nr:MarR family winged helix-turn-helix transcriptional regulator [Paenibacillus sp. P96]MDP4095856.1 MarR family winged helix-turn-helix transcriptional regulator [Paenibacillus sp. P96]